jgi:hypothetical protein
VLGGEDAIEPAIVGCADARRRIGFPGETHSPMTPPIRNRQPMPSAELSASAQPIRRGDAPAARRSSAARWRRRPVNRSPTTQRHPGQAPDTPRRRPEC